MEPQLKLLEIVRITNNSVCYLLLTRLSIFFYVSILKNKISIPTCLTSHIRVSKKYLGAPSNTTLLPHNYHYKVVYVLLIIRCNLYLYFALRVMSPSLLCYKPIKYL